MNPIEGVDYSTTANGNWPGLATAMVNAGKQFVGRYAVNDKSPGGRGITYDEFAAMKAKGVGVFVYWEGHESWMLGGYNAGVAAAKNAQQNILSAGMRATMPIYFAHDIEPDPDHFAAIDDCLRGCASVVGWERVGVYGGWLLIDYMAGGGTVKWLCQTYAWEYGHGKHPAAVLYQYDNYDNYIYGTNVDLVRAYAENYGQSELPAPPPPPVPTYPPSRPVPRPLLQGHDHVDAKGNKWYACHRTVHVAEGTKFYVNASTTSKQADAPAGKGGEDRKIVGRVNAWYVEADGKSFQVKNADVAVSFKGK